MNVNNNLSSMYAHEQLLNSSAHNIANANTESFDRVETNIQEKGTDSVEAVHKQIENETPYSNTDLTKEIPNQIISYHAVGANAVALSTKEETERTVLDILA